MKYSTQKYHYQTIEKSITFITNNFKQQPTLEEIASHVNMSSFHFQRLFNDWAGTSPKKFLQYISLQYAKEKLKKPQANLFNTSVDSGLSGTGRLHDLFVNIEGMTPGEFKNKGKDLEISYRFENSVFGKILISSTERGICKISFADSETESVNELKTLFPNACIIKKNSKIQESVLPFFNADWENLQQVKLHLKGTEFQLKVWEALIQIPMGKLSTYSDIALQTGNPKASRAVGTAIGSNPIAYLIPCHRVIQTSGKLGGYHWGITRKTAMIGWEAAKTETF